MKWSRQSLSFIHISMSNSFSWNVNISCSHSLKIFNSRLNRLNKYDVTCAVLFDVTLSCTLLMVYRECVIVGHYLVVYRECVIIVALPDGVLWACHYRGITWWCTMSVLLSWHYLVVYCECVIIVALSGGVLWVCHYHGITSWCTVSVSVSWHYLVVYRECVIIMALPRGVPWVCHYHSITWWCTVSVLLSWHYLVFTAAVNRQSFTWKKY